MKTQKLSAIGPVFLLAAFAVGTLAGNVLGGPAALLGLGAVLLALRIGVIATAVAEPASDRPVRPSAAPAPALRVANG